MTLEGHRPQETRASGAAPRQARSGRAAHRRPPALAAVPGTSGDHVLEPRGVVERRARPSSGSSSSWVGDDARGRRAAWSNLGTSGTSVHAPRARVVDDERPGGPAATGPYFGHARAGAEEGDVDALEGLGRKAPPRRPPSAESGLPALFGLASGTSRSTGTSGPRAPAASHAPRRPSRRPPPPRIHAAVSSMAAPLAPDGCPLTEGGSIRTPAPTLGHGTVPLPGRAPRAARRAAATLPSGVRRLLVAHGPGRPGRRRRRGGDARRRRRGRRRARSAPAPDATGGGSPPTLDAGAACADLGDAALL